MAEEVSNGVQDGRGAIPALAAPTASGKTAAALVLARDVGLEVVSADAMQVYRGLDVGTAKPTADERRLVPHHLIDVADPSEAFDVARFVRLAEAAIADVLGRGRIPLVVGGTGFYLEALMEGLPGTPPSDPARRQEIEAELEERGLEALLRELAAAAPHDVARAQRNPRRVVRALEVLRATGAAPSAHPPVPPRFRFRAAILHPDPDRLAERIRARTRALVAAGWPDEVRRLAPGMGSWTTARQAIGYEELRRHLAGELTLDEAVTAIDLATLRYAKRQRTWFRRRPAGALRVAGTGDEALPALRTWLAGRTV